MILDFGYLFIELGLKVPDINGNVRAQHTRVLPSGRAFNQAVAAARMGAKVSLIGAIGDDLFGKEILSRLQREGITATGIIRTKEPTGMLTRVMSDSKEHLNVMSIGANKDAKPLQVPLLALNHKALLVLQDDVGVEDNTALLQRARNGGAITVMNIQSVSQYSKIVDFVDVLIAREGLDLPESPNLIRYYPQNTLNFDASFAEDCFCGAMAACLQAGMDIENAQNHANAMASLSGQITEKTDRFAYLDQVLEVTNLRQRA